MESIVKELNSGKTLTEILSYMLKMQKINELNKAKENSIDGELEEILDDIESMYMFNLEKLEYVDKLIGKDINTQKKFLEIVMYIDNKKLSNYNTVCSILTSAVMLNELNNHPEYLSNDELYLITTSMISIPVNDYKMYGDILTDRRIIDNIKGKTDEVDEQRNICYDIFDYCDDYTTNDMSNEQYLESIKDCLKIIKDYEVKTTEKSK